MACTEFFDETLPIQSEELVELEEAADCSQLPLEAIAFSQLAVALEIPDIALVPSPYQIRRGGWRITAAEYARLSNEPWPPGLAAQPSLETVSALNAYRKRTFNYP